MDASSQPDAVADGRRIYLGNLQYEVEPAEIEDVLVAAGFGNFKQIHLSIDPVNGRNPGYCFVDFADKDAAEKALADLNTSIRDRPLKVGPCRPKQSRPADLWGRERDSRDSSRDNNNSRWGRDNRDGDRTDSPRSTASFSQRAGDWRRADDSDSNRPRRDGTGTSDQPVGKRLYFGGLGQVDSQDQNLEEMSELLAGFKPTSIGKRVTAHSDGPPKPGNHNYCFVDFETSKEAAEVLKALNGTPYQDGFLRVAAAKERTERTERTDRQGDRTDERKSSYRRENGDNWGRDSNRDSNRESTPSKPKAFETGSWRR